MKLLLTSDIHSDLEKFKKILETVEFDVLLIAGDLTNFSREDVITIDQIISDKGIECYAVHGNCDYEEILNYNLNNIQFLHGESVEVDNFSLHGLGGSLKTPFNTLSEYSEEEYAKLISGFELSDFNVLLSHCPAKGRLDRTRYGLNIGSEEIAKNLHKFDVAVSGHVHESFGIQGGKILSINPGPVMWGMFATLELPRVDVRLDRI
ncbi:MAG: metallophosphoesterase [Archaeoglobaceae archaeon]